MSSVGGAAQSWALEQTLVARGSTWRYRDGGQAPGSGWTAANYDDSGWPSGAAQLGYGDGDEVTVVSYGGNANAKAITTYFRTTFTVQGAAVMQRLETRLLCDDGAVIFLNDAELRRDNLPAGVVGPTTLATTAVAGSAESAFVTGYTDAAPLREGVNVLAVEVHQVSATSSDISFDFELIASDAPARISRGPYLQLGAPTGVVVRWRTDVPTNSRVWYGSQLDALGLAAGDGALTTEHVVALTGLASDTVYYYAVGTDATVLGGGDEAHRFRTGVSAGVRRAARLWAVGDAGTGGAGARAVRDSYLDFAAGAAPDLWLMLGDNAYQSGTDAEYQRGLFDVYQALLTRSVLWPTLGNHDGVSANSALQTGPYYDLFTLPAAGQAGGVASGTEAYYSFDVGRIHFVCLDSNETDRSPGSAMLTWLASDLAATTADWAIAFWHHPPYSRGSHDSDTEAALVEMRQNVLPVLEAGGVDLVLSGHSHAYERSLLLDGHYGVSSTLQSAMLRDAGDGRVEGDGPYAKPSTGLRAHSGTVYVVAGSGAQVGGGTLDHPVMATSLNILGSLVLDVVGDTLSGRFLSDTAAVRDRFTLTKGAVPLETVSGSVRYYRADRPVSDVAVTASAASDGGGGFAVSVPRGAPVAVAPRKRGGASGAVSALDAAYVLQFVAGLRALDAMQVAACDVTANGTLSTLDASEILRYVVGLDVHLPVADRCGSDFAFAPASSTPIDGRMVPFAASMADACQPGAVELEPVTSAVTGLQFLAAAFGDCTGNWQPSPAASRAHSKSAPARVRIGRPRRSRERWRLAFTVGAEVPFSSVELAFALAPGHHLDTLRPRGSARDALLATSGGRAAIASPRPLRRLRLEVSGRGPISATDPPLRITGTHIDR